jgi:transcriptional regulator
MYVPSHFEETRIETLHSLIQAYPLGTLVTLTAQGLEASHIPFEIDPAPAPFGTLRCHVARVNSIWKDFSRDIQALAVFHGVDAYISPSWYPTKYDSGKVVPTWNYAVVHAYGPLQVIEDRQWLRQFVERLTSRHESGRSNPWKVSDAPADYIDQLLGTIVGIEMPIARLIGKWKVSQNRPARDQAGAVEGLLELDTEESRLMADLIRNRQAPER